jgi:hypothetical protein
MKMPKIMERILMAVRFFLFALITAPFLGVNFSHSGDVLAGLAVLVVVLLLLHSQ